MGLCSSDDFAPKNHAACSQHIRSFKASAHGGKNETRKVQKGNTSQLLLKFNIQTTRSSPLGGCLLSVWLKDRPFEHPANEQSTWFQSLAPTPLSPCDDPCAGRSALPEEA